MSIRTVTMKQLDAFSALLTEIRVAMREMAPIADGLAVLVAASDPSDPAQAAIPIQALRAGAQLQQRATALLQRFEVMAGICFGEKRRPDESPVDFVARFGTMDEHEMFATMARNGVRLVSGRR